MQNIAGGSGGGGRVCKLPGKYAAETRICLVAANLNLAHRRATRRPQPPRSILGAVKKARLPPLPSLKVPG